MLNKNRLLATLLFFCFSTIVPSGTLAQWQNLDFQTLLEPGIYLSRERWRISPDQIILPQFTQLNPQNSCYRKNMIQFLQQQIINQPVKIKFIKSYAPPHLNRTAQIKFNKTLDLAEFLLRQGWAHLDTQIENPLKTYLVAQTEAQKQRRGMWGSCDNWYTLREKQRLKGKTAYFKSAYKSLLLPVSTGWVKKVLDPNVIELNSGQKIKLQAIRVPEQDSPLKRCWHNEVTKGLETLVLGKKVRLESDHLQLTSKGQQLQRFVWLEGNRWQAPLLLNQYLIEQNWAQLEDAELNLKYVDVLKNSAQTAFRKDSIPSWWLTCGPMLVGNSSTPSRKPPESLVYDEICPIKGNVSGSKKNPKQTYHTPASGWYKRIEAEACFADETSAQAEGFVKVK